MIVRPLSPQTLAFTLGVVVVACSAGENAPGSGDDGAGGAAGTGGAAPSGGLGGSSVGGSPSGGTAGATGGSSSGGSAGNATGGTGGKACTNVRPTGTEWDEATCEQWATETEECGNSWMISGNYCNESCGRCGAGTGGSAGTTAGTGTGGATTGGAGGSGGTDPVDIPDTCTAADGQVCNNQSGDHCGYTYEYWKDQGTGCLTNKSNGFSVEWTNVNNLLGRKGLRPGSKSQIVSYQATYAPVGSSYLCVYGWTRNPLVEYYIVDSWGDWRPPGGTALGSIESDGGTYELYRTERENAPSIDGTRTFSQYWSVRTAKRTSGTITVANHFNAWTSAGMNTGSLYEVSMTVEGYQSSGTADVALVMR
jgi:endo-1,4-beta-xylanase